MKLQRLLSALVRAAMRVQQMVPASQAISGQLVQRAAAAAHFLRTRWVEVLAFGSPFALLAASLLAPVAPFTLTDDASIANVAAVQGAVTGLSLIALVLAVEMARRQEDRDDVVYEIMLQSAWIRPTFVFALAALLATLIGMSWSDLFASSDRSTTSPNLLLSTYVLTGLTGLALLYQLLKDQSDEPLPSFDGYAQRFIDVWKGHSDIIMKAAEIDEVRHAEVSGRVVARLETSSAAEQREGDDRALAAGIDQQRVTGLITELRKERAEDRVLEYRFAEADRVRRVNESDWSNGQLGQGWLLPRDVFAVDSTIEPMRLTGAASGFERGLFVQLAKELEGAREASQLASAGVDDVLHAIDVGLHELACAQPLIVLHGKWPREAIVELWQHSSVGDRPLTWAKTDFRQVRVEYKGHWLVQSWTDGTPVLLMLDLERWGWLVRAPIGGEEFGLEFEEIGREEAEQMVDDNPEQGGDREERIRERMLKVRLVAQERVKFEVENPDAALRIPVRTADET